MKSLLHHQSNKGVVLALFFLFSMMAACQAEPPPPAPLPTDTALPNETSLPATATSSPSSPTPTIEIIPSATHTLAPFPVQDENTSLVNPDFANVRPASYTAPLALSAQDHFYFSHPIEALALEKPLPSSRYGSLQSSEDRNGHTGLDIAVDIGTPVLAAGSGTVLWSGYGLYYGYENEADPFGIAIAIRHDFGFKGERLYTVYAHLSESLVEPGQIVEAGDRIGLSGNTGFSSGPHLHFEVRVGKNTIYHSLNPELWLIPPEGWGVLVGRIFTTYGTRVENHAMQITSLDSGRILWVYSYATDLNVGMDPYYDENFILGDLPAGRYEIAIPYVNGTQRTEIEILPGAVTFFSFHGYDGFNFQLPREIPPPHLPSEQN